MTSYMSVDRELILKAFRHAHLMGETAERGHERKEFRKIAKLIWDACGEEKAMPSPVPPERCQWCEKPFMNCDCASAKAEK